MATVVNAGLACTISHSIRDLVDCCPRWPVAMPVELPLMCHLFSAGRP